VNVTHIVATTNGDLEPSFHTDGMKMVFIEICLCKEFMNMSPRHPDYLVGYTCEAVVMRVLIKLSQANAALYLMDVSLLLVT